MFPSPPLFHPPLLFPSPPLFHPPLLFPSPSPTVTAVPQFAHPQQSLWTVRQGQNITLPCSLTNMLEGVAYNTTWRWRGRSGENYILHQSYSATDGQRDLVVVRPSATSTRLVYECIVVGVNLKRTPSVASNLFGIHPSSGSHQLIVHTDPPQSECERLGCQK